MKHRQGSRWILLALLLALAGMAHAGEVYKCTAGGAVVFQDQPCPGQPPGADRQAQPGPAGIDNASPAALMARLRVLAQQERELRLQQEQERLRLKARFDGDPDTAAVAMRLRRFKQDWQQRFAALREENGAVLARLRTLCPGGAAGGGGRVICNKAGPG